MNNGFDTDGPHAKSGCLQNLLFHAELTEGQEITLYVVKAGWANNQPVLLAAEFAQALSQ